MFILHIQISVLTLINNFFFFNLKFWKASWINKLVLQKQQQKLLHEWNVHFFFFCNSDPAVLH